MKQEDILQIAQECGIEIDAGNSIEDYENIALTCFAHRMMAEGAKEAAEFVEGKYDFHGGEIVAAIGIRRLAIKMEKGEE